MRRLRATLWLAFFSLSLIAPAGFTFSTSELPECCRAAGKHHCSMRRSGRDSSGVSIRSVRECPNFPVVRFTPAQTYSSLPSVELNRWNPLRSGASPHAQGLTLYQVNLDGAGQKRGPPAIFL